MNENPIAIHPGSPFFEVAQCRERWFLRNGYHRTLISRLPVVLARTRTLEELGAMHPWFVPEEVLFSAAPPRAIDFPDDALVFEYHRSPLRKKLSITIEETTLRGENL